MVSHFFSTVLAYMHSVETMFTLRTFSYHVLENYLHDERKSYIQVDTNIIFFFKQTFQFSITQSYSIIISASSPKWCHRRIIPNIFTSHLGHDTCRCHLVDFVQRFFNPVRKIMNSILFRQRLWESFLTKTVGKLSEKDCGKAF